jgi:flagellar hook-basal body complex protein FliE
MMSEFKITPNDPSLNPMRSNAPGSVNKQINGKSFAQWLNKSIETVNTMQAEADLAARKLITGENKDIHGTMISMQKADVAMNLMMEVRNKIIAAYDEIKRMQF